MVLPGWEAPHMSFRLCQGFIKLESCLVSMGDATPLSQTPQIGGHGKGIHCLFPIFQNSGQLTGATPQPLSQPSHLSKHQSCEGQGTRSRTMCSSLTSQQPGDEDLGAHMHLGRQLRTVPTGSWSHWEADMRLNFKVHPALSNAFPEPPCGGKAGEGNLD